MHRTCRLGSRELTNGLPVGAEDISGLVVTIAAPPHLPKLRGTIAGASSAIPADARVELTGRVIGTLEARVRKDGSFEFPAVAPGTYQVRVPQIPAATPSYVVVGWTDTELQLSR